MRTNKWLWRHRIKYAKTCTTHTATQKRGLSMRSKCGPAGQRDLRRSHISGEIFPLLCRKLVGLCQKLRLMFDVRFRRNFLIFFSPVIGWLRVAQLFLLILRVFLREISSNILMKRAGFFELKCAEYLQDCRNTNHTCGKIIDWLDSEKYRSIANKPKTRAL